MCVLCGDLTTDVHWTDQNDRHDEGNIRVVGDDRQRLYQRIRLERVRIIDRILSIYGLHISDWHGVKYIISDMKGNSEIVNHLGEIWVTCDMMLSRTLDPLDPIFLKSFQDLSLR